MRELIDGTTMPDTATDAMLLARKLNDVQTRLMLLDLIWHCYQPRGKGETLEAVVQKSYFSAQLVKC